MGINVRKNIQFTKLVKAPTQLKEFNFRKLPGEEALFHVDVNDDRGNRIVFSMKRDDESWKIVSLVPKWISDNESRLSDAIEEMLRQ